MVNVDRYAGRRQRINIGGVELGMDPLAIVVISELINVGRDAVVNHFLFLGSI